MAKMDAPRSSTSRRFYSSMSSALCSVPASKTAVTNTYHLLNQGKITIIRLKRMPVPTPHTIVQHSFRLQAKNGKFLIVFLFHVLEMYSYSLSFHRTTFTLF